MGGSSSDSVAVVCEWRKVFLCLKAGKRNLFAGTVAKIVSVGEGSSLRACALVTRLVGILV